MIDLQPMKAIAIDAPGRVGEVGRSRVCCGGSSTPLPSGMVWRPGGEVSDTGVAGLTLGGGVGWLSRLHGLAADNLVGARLVTADGAILDVSDETDPELMWGLRGGGGNFGIVTRFLFRLHPVAPFFGGMVLYPGDAAADVLQTVLQYGDAMPRETALTAAMISAPPAPGVPPELVGSP